MAVAHFEVSELEGAQRKHFEADQFLHEGDNVGDVDVVVEGDGGGQGCLCVFAG
jgi:hypothetical protein